MHTDDPVRWLAGALREEGRSALAMLLDAYVYLPLDRRAEVWPALVLELLPTHPTEQHLRAAASAIDSLGCERIDRAAHAVGRARAAWEAAR